MKKVLWIIMLLFVSCSTITESNNDEIKPDVSIQYDETGGAGEGNGTPPPPPPPPGNGG